MILEKNLIKEFGREDYIRANKKVWDQLDQGSKNSIPFQALLKLIKKELSK